MGSIHLAGEGTMWMRSIARGLALLWAGWWTFFGLASGIGEKAGLLGVLIHTTVPGLIFLITVLIAWRWEPVGGILLILEGLWAIFFFKQRSLAAFFFMLGTITLPPLSAGFLLLISWRKGR